MEFKKFLVNKLILFFLLSTLITAAISGMGSVFDGEASLSYGDMRAPLVYAALCMLPTFVTWSSRELSPREMLLRKAVMLVLIEAVILLIGFTSPKIDTDRVEVVLALAGSVLVIFVLAHLFLWLKDSAEAKKMNLALEQFQQRHTDSQTGREA